MDHPSRPIAAALATATAEDLRRHAPFDRMERHDLDWLVARLSVVYFAPDAVVMSPADGTAQWLYIVKQGAVPGFSPERTGEQSPRWHLSVGECFPLGALIAARPVTSRYEAAGDVFCYRLPAEDFHALLARSAAFRDFATQRLAALLIESRRAQLAETATGSRQPLERALREMLPDTTIYATSDESVRVVLERMRAGRGDSALIVDDTGRATGIFTLRDLRDRVALAGRDVALPIGDVMTPDPVGLAADTMGFEAALTMADRGFRHIVVTENGRATGCVSESDLFAMQRIGVPAVAASLRSARDLSDLVRLSRRIGELARELALQAMPAEHLTRLVATLNDALTRRVVELVAPECSVDLDDFCWLAFGSEGRHEQTFVTDQDNGLVFRDTDAAHRETRRAAFLALARQVNDALAACGFPLCKGQVMAGNPRWCLTFPEWQAAFGAWMHAPDGPALLNASIFFDLRPLCGNTDLGAELSHWLFAVAAGEPVFLRLLAETALRNEPPLGVIRDFVLADHDGHPDTLDIKVNGATLFVDAARVLSLASGEAASGTAGRLRGVARRRPAATAEIEGWLDAFHFVQHVRLDHQLRCISQGRQADNHVSPDTLNALDRRILKEALRQARKLQERLRLDFRL
jgi:CBS domain-containing protein